MWAAVSAWEALAAALGSAASSFQSAVAGLTGAAWQGPASMTMAAAADPYVQWLTAASANAAQVAMQARLLAGAFEVAFTGTVPPEIVAANRALLIWLIATNLLGQNTAAIATTEAQYAEMWAQDVTAMTGYDASTAAIEAQWTPFSTPPLTLTGLPAAEPTSLLSLLQQLFSSASHSPLLSSMSQQLIAGPAQIAMEPMNMAISQLMAGASPLISPPTSGAPAMGLVSAVSPAATGTAALTPRVVSAGVGRAGSVGRLSVPPSWSAAAPAAGPLPATAGAGSAGVNQVSTRLPTPPYLPPKAFPGPAARAVVASRDGVAPRQALE